MSDERLKGDSGSAFRRTLHLLLTPSPGRLRNTLIQVLSVLIIAVIWEVYRIPETSVACYFVLFTNKNDRTSTGGGAKGVAVLGTVAMMMAILILMVGLSEPAIRICLMALFSFAAMFMSRASKAGTAFFAAGFLVVYSLTSADSIGGIALQTATVSNSTSGGWPNIVFMPPEESLVRGLLWFIVVVVVPGMVVVLVNKAFGRDPAQMLKGEIEARLDACASFCERQPGAGTRLLKIARGSSPELLPLAELAEKDHGAKAEPIEQNQAAIRAVTRLMLACLAIDRTRGEAERPGWMADAAERCRALGRGDFTDAAGPFEAGDDLLGREVGVALDHLAAAQRAKADPARRVAEQPKKGFWTDDPGSAANVKFALKVTLSVMLCYVLVNALDWSGIGTAVTTSFFVSLGNLGESGHKMTLRICGALLGSAMGIGAIIVLMPAMTGLGDLLPLLAVATFIGAWVGSGSPRVAYAGLQISFAFFIVVLQGYGPVTDMEAAKNRVVGILIGNVVSYFVMALIWPVNVERLVTASLADAAAALGELLRRPAAPDRVREKFAKAISKTRTLLLDGLYEGTTPDRIEVGDALVDQVEALVIPVSMLAAIDAPTYPDVLASWFDETAGRLRGGARKPGAYEPPPSVPDPASGHPVTYALLRRELDALPFSARG